MEQIDMKAYVLSKIKFQDGIKILDLGCGDGGELLAIGKRFRNAAYYGLDVSADGIERAKASASGDARFHFERQNLSAGIPFDDHFFDAVYAIDLLECIVDKAVLLREIHRVLKPGGQVLMAHYDFDTQLFDGTDKNLVRRVVQTYNDWQQAWMDDCDAWMGRRLWKHMNGSGLFKGSVDAYVMTNTRFEPGRFGYDRAMDFGVLVKRGMISEADYAAFLGDLRNLSDADHYFYSINMFFYDGIKVPAVT